MTKLFREQPEDGLKLSNWRWVQIGIATVIHFIFWHSAFSDMGSPSSGSSGDDSDAILGGLAAFIVIEAFSCFTTARAPRFWLASGLAQCLIPFAAALSAWTEHRFGASWRDAIWVGLIFGVFCTPFGPIPTFFIRNAIARRKQRLIDAKIDLAFQQSISAAGVWPPAPVAPTLASATEADPPKSDENN